MEWHSSNICNIHKEPSSNNPDQESAILNGLFMILLPSNQVNSGSVLKQVINYCIPHPSLFILHYNHIKLAGITTMF